MYDKGLLLTKASLIYLLFALAYRFEMVLMPPLIHQYHIVITQQFQLDASQFQAMSHANPGEVKYHAGL